MRQHSESRIVPYSADLMYRVVAEVENYPKFLPWVVALRVLSRDADGLTAEMAVGYGALRERYTSHVALDPVARTIDVTQARTGRPGLFSTLQNHWRFTPLPDGGCKVEFSIAFAFRSRLLQGAAGKAFSRVMLTLADAFEQRAKALSRP